MLNSVVLLERLHQNAGALWLELDTIRRPLRLAGHAERFGERRVEVVHGFGRRGAALELADRAAQSLELRILLLDELEQALHLALPRLGRLVLLIVLDELLVDVAVAVCN